MKLFNNPTEPEEVWSARTSLEIMYVILRFPQYRNQIKFLFVWSINGNCLLSVITSLHIASLSAAHCPKQQTRH